MRLSRQSYASPTVYQYCEELLWRMQNGKCAHCSQQMRAFQLHHKRYGDDITLYDLELIHGQCHAKEHGVASTKGLERDASHLANLSQVA